MVDFCIENISIGSSQVMSKSNEFHYRIYDIYPHIIKLSTNCIRHIFTHISSPKLFAIGILIACLTKSNEQVFDANITYMVKMGGTVEKIIDPSAQFALSILLLKEKMYNSFVTYIMLCQQERIVLDSPMIIDHLTKHKLYILLTVFSRFCSGIKYLC
jgi:hypothetical protein